MDGSEEQTMFYQSSVWQSLVTFTQQIRKTEKTINAALREGFVACQPISKEYSCRQWNNINLLYWKTLGQSVKMNRLQDLESKWEARCPFSKRMLSHAPQSRHIRLTMQPIMYGRLILALRGVRTRTLPCSFVIKPPEIEEHGNVLKERGTEKNTCPAGEYPVNGNMAQGGKKKWTFDRWKRQWKRLEHKRWSRTDGNEMYPAGFNTVLSDSAVMWVVRRSYSSLEQNEPGTQRETGNTIAQCNAPTLSNISFASPANFFSSNTWTTETVRSPGPGWSHLQTAIFQN